MMLPAGQNENQLKMKFLRLLTLIICGSQILLGLEGNGKRESNQVYIVLTSISF